MSSHNHSLWSVQRDKEEVEESEGGKGGGKEKGGKNCFFGVSLYQGTNPIGLGLHLYDIIDLVSLTFSSLYSHTGN